VVSGTIFAYDNWSFNILTNFSVGNTVYSSANVTAHDVGGNRFRITKWQEKDFVFWEQPGDNATLARLVYGDPLKPAEDLHNGFMMQVT
jgi:hypothetical protein